MPGCIVLPWNFDAMKHLRIILIYNGFRWLQLESFIQFCCVETTPLEVIADASLERPDHKHVRMRLIIISKDDYAELETFLLTINFIIALYRCLSAHLLYNLWLFNVSVFHTKHYWLYIALLVCALHRYHMSSVHSKKKIEKWKKGGTQRK